jgi:hypothetical protein
MRVQTKRWIWMLALLAVPGWPAPAQESSEPGRVKLPLADYLTLIERAETAERQAEEAAEEALAELTARRTEIAVRGEEARVRESFEVQVRGAPGDPVPLPLTGWAERATVAPDTGAALDRSAGSGLQLVPWRPGSYRVEVEGARKLEEAEGVLRLPLPAGGAPVAATRLDLPAELGWSCSGAVVVEEETAGGRRRLQLALDPGRDHVLKLRRQVDPAAEEALVRSAVVTLMELTAAGTRRHDVVLYEVLRGELARFELSLPPGPPPERLATDEGEITVLPQAGDAGAWKLERHRRLGGNGYAMLSWPSAAVGEMSLDPVEPAVPVGARYLVLTASVATRAEPLPAAGWRRVDLSDLPVSVQEGLDLSTATAAWRRVGQAGPSSLTVSSLPPASLAPARVQERETTTLLTVDGSLVHRERFTLRGVDPALEVELPEAATLWSVTVDGLQVRPLTRGGRLTVPLTFAEGFNNEVEVVAVEERTVPRGRSRLELELARVELPVLQHRWRLLLPESGRYRFAVGTLAPAAAGALPPDRGGFRLVESPADLAESAAVLGPGGDAGLRGRVVAEDGSPLPGVTVELSGSRLRKRLVAVTDGQGGFRFESLPAGVVEVTAHLDGFQRFQKNLRLGAGRSRLVEIPLHLATVMEEIVVTAERGSGRSSPSDRELERLEAGRRQQELFDSEVGRLRQGLTGGVRPLPVEVPESGKLLLLTGALPPSRVAVELDVKTRH